MERSNTELANAALHESTIAGLEHFADNGHPNFKHTAEFLRYIRHWFDIVNVMNAYLHSRLNDSNRKPITLEDKEGLEYLNNCGQWMINWHEWRGKSLKMSNDTMLAASHTSFGLVDLAKYLLGKHSDKLRYILLGKIQSDNIEGRFGHLRKLVGGNYWASVRQFYEGESVIRARSLVSFSGYSINEVKEEMKNIQQDRLNTDNIVMDKTVNFLSINPIQDLLEKI